MRNFDAPRGKKSKAPEIGERIAKIRKDQRLTQEQLARHLHVTKQQIGKYETGENDISAIKLYELAQYLKVNINAFYKEEKNERCKYEIEPELLSEPDIPELLRNWKKMEDRQRGVVIQLLRVMTVPTLRKTAMDAAATATGAEEA